MTATDSPAGLIRDDEPVFLLRASDKYAADALRWYANHVAFWGGDGRAVRLALEHADEMDAWRKRKESDMP